jgi:hypothetical protein
MIDIKAGDWAVAYHTEDYPNKQEEVDAFKEKLKWEVERLEEVVSDEFKDKIDFEVLSNLKLQTFHTMLVTEWKYMISGKAQVRIMIKEKNND